MPETLPLVIHEAHKWNTYGFRSPPYSDINSKFNYLLDIKLALEKLGYDIFFKNSNASYVENYFEYVETAGIHELELKSVTRFTQQVIDQRVSFINKHREKPIKGLPPSVILDEILSAHYLTPFRIKSRKLRIKTYTSWFGRKEGDFNKYLTPEQQGQALLVSKVKSIPQIKNSDILQIDIDHPNAEIAFFYLYQKHFNKACPLFIEQGLNGHIHAWYKLDKLYTDVQKLDILKTLNNDIKHLNVQIEFKDKLRLPNSHSYAPVQIIKDVLIPRPDLKEIWFNMLDFSKTLSFDIPQIAIEPLKLKPVIEPILEPVENPPCPHVMRPTSKPKISQVITKGTRHLTSLKILSEYFNRGMNFDQAYQRTLELNVNSYTIQHYPERHKKDCIQIWEYFKKHNATYSLQKRPPNKEFVSNLGHITGDSCLNKKANFALLKLFNQTVRSNLIAANRLDLLDKFKVAFLMVGKEMLGYACYDLKNGKIKTPTSRLTDKKFSDRYLQGSQYSKKYCKLLKDYYNLSGIDIYKLSRVILKSKLFLCSNSNYSSLIGNNYCRQYLPQKLEETFSGINYPRPEVWDETRLRRYEFTHLFEQDLRITLDPQHHGESLTYIVRPP